MSFSYDSSALKLDMTETNEEGNRVMLGDNSVRIVRYGKEAALGEALTLKFEVLAGKGSSNVTVTSAKVDTNGNAIEADAPDATILRPAATVTVSGYTVTLPDDFTRTDAPGSTIIEAGGNLTFVPKDPNYDYDVKVIVAVLLCVLLLIPTMAFAETQSFLDAEIAQSAEGMSALGGKKGELLKDQEQFPAGTSVCDWLAMAMALSGAEESYADYLQALRTYVENAYAKNGCLDKNKATEYHRIALTVMALGGDPTDFGTKPDGSAIDLIAEGTYNYARDPGAQGLNGWIWALIALDAQDTEVPADAQYSREDMVSAIVIAQEPDGGFGLIPGKSDVDITAMAVQALAPYRDRLETEIDAALEYLSGQLTDTCGYIAYGDENAESTAQVILALCALGIDEDLFYWLHEADFYGQSQIGLAESYTDTAVPLSMTVKNLSACSAHGYYPYAVYGSETLEADRIGDTMLPPAESLSYLKGSVPEWYQIQRNLSSAQGRENIKNYLSKEQAYSDYLQTVDLQMTQDSWSVLQRQLKLDSQARTIGDIRTIIFDYLRENMTYDESARTMNGSGDFLQYTLERSGHGYSVHYATAAVLMLRYMGVPARYVEGYFLSAEDAARYKAGEAITLTEKNAHAWAEYYVSGVGFVPFEVTPGYIDDEELSLGGDSPDENTYRNNTRQFVEVEKPEEITEHKQDRFTFSLDTHYLLLLPLLLILLLAGYIFHRRRAFRKKLAAIDAADDREAIAMRYGYAVCLLRHSTANPPEGASEAAELNQKALFSTQEMTPEQRKDVDAYAMRVLAACKSSWTLWEKIRYRLWNCLY